ncbi:hypothetical protein CLG85_020485 [Yangia mangrovi]|uniref:AlpA family transcriptional regulator n=1 Tax=Alloyangia mangrovi TaxID=1779329 RepID=A0A2A3JXZ2_9RHOB|nr:AlpA family transcriptional regulator [Alloyangia mangrovi]MCT4372557.1 hypothetical protein [Alloyangia mangrovi]
MTKYERLAIRATQAARMLSLSHMEFRRLVGLGVLPAPIFLGGTELWVVDDLKAILSGADVEQQEFRT